MGLLDGTTQQQYYDVKKSFTGDGATVIFTVSNSEDTFPAVYDESNVEIYIDNVLIISNSYTFEFTSADGWNVDFNNATGTVYGAPANGAAIVVDVDSNFGNYQFVSLNDIINNFMISQVGEGKLISKVRRSDVVFHAHRALAELSFDTFKSTKSQEIEIPASLNMILPHDYVNYVKLVWSDSAGIERIIYPASKTSNPKAIKQDSDGNYSFDIDDDTSVPVDEKDDTVNLINNNNSDTWDKYKAGTPSENQDDYNDNTYWSNEGRRYGLDPQHAQVNGSFFIDELKGKIHFSSNISGKTVILKYISDSLGTDDEMQVHKLAEEAMYKWIAYAVISTKINVPEYIVLRFKKERFAETRKAKLRLSNIKLEEITQILRGRSKQIKH